jgi:hypothetical protein
MINLGLSPEKEAILTKQEEAEIRMIRKIEMNSFYKPCGNPLGIFNFYNEDLAKKFEESDKQALKELLSILE